MNPISKKYDEVYYIESVRAPGYNAIAISPQVPREHVISWRDNCGKGSRVEAESIDTTEAPNRIIVHINKTSTLTLHRLTLDLYNRTVKDLLWGNPTFDTENAMREFFLTTDFS
jgi:hypothetical protein